MYSNAYIMALPSDLEGMSLSLLEALSYGNAVLCSDIPENTSVAEDWAVYFKKGNVDDLAEKLDMMCKDRKIVDDLRAGAGEFITEKYNWDDIARQTLELYKKQK
jgi:glycosyltransferase involved in cell wall biosynthesis